MGNVQASSIANQLLPVESYINDVPQMKYSHSLGSTRFMKVARADLPDGPVIIKVFVLGDQSFSVEPYREQILQIRKRISKHPNCCPFTRVYMNSRCAILCRSYLKHTLYDRLNNRPFLLDVEKRWIAFQLLKALAQCRIAMVFHGDIKSENVLVSGSLWVLLTDFASFKPTFVPYDNPSNFTFFFDTSRRRCCTLAPERFKKSEEVNYSSRLPGDFVNISEGLTESMDIFAMGCVIYELFTNNIAFTLPQAIDYKRMDERLANQYLKKMLSEIPTDFVELLEIMLDRDPVRRKEEFTKFSPCTSNLFPPIFERYLYRYFKDFQLSMGADDLITKLFVERNNYLPQLDNGRDDAVLLFIDLVTSNLRACRSLSAKMDAISLLQEFSKMMPSVVGDRIIPYLAHLLTDCFPQVRSEAVFVLTEILAAFSTSIPSDECRLMIDFIFPKMKLITSDCSNHVKIALASNIGQLAMISLKFLQESISQLRNEAEMMSKPSSVNFPSTEEDLEDNEKLLIKTEHQALQETVSELFVNLCGSDNEVRQCLFSPQNLELLCQFLGPSQATDILMHMITLLNDKPDWRMRATFFESCPVVARHLGKNRCSKLKPFLQQGMQDCKEFVVMETLNCIHSLCNEELLLKSVICDLMRDVVPFLVHPNKWLRAAVVNILTVLDVTFIMPDFYCKITPLVKPYLKEDLIRLNDKTVIYNCLIDPIPREIWTLVSGYNYIGELMCALESKRTVEKLGGGKNSLFSATSFTVNPSSLGSGESCPISSPRLQKVHSDTNLAKEPSVSSIIKKLMNLGLNDEIEDKLLPFKDILTKMDTIKGLSCKCELTDGNLARRTCSCSELSHIHLSDLSKVSRKVFDLDKGVHQVGNAHLNSIVWKDTYCTSDLQHNINNVSELSNTTSECLPDVESAILAEDCPGIHFGSSVTHMWLEETLIHKQKRYKEQKRITGNNREMHNSEIASKIAAATGMDIAEDGDADVRKFSSSTIDQLTTSKRRRLELRLLSHLHEHSDKIIKLALHPDKNHFASCSADKTVKLWAANSMDNSHPIALSQDTFRYAHKINSCSFVGRGHLVTASDDGDLQVFDIQHKRILKSYQIDRENDGPIVQLHSFDHLIYALTHHSGIVCFDLRIAPKTSRNSIQLEPVWKRRAKNSYGLMTSMCVDALNQHWMLLTASSATTKNMILCDLRFGGLEVSSWSHPSEKIIPLQTWPLLRGAKCNEAFTNASREGEISLWDLSSQSRSDVFWPSSETPLVYKQELVTSALAQSCVDNDTIFTGDSEGSLRCWNLKRVEQSNYLSGPYRKYLHDGNGSPISSNSTNLQDLKATLPRIRYDQVIFRDNLLRIQTEDRSQLGSVLERETHKILQVGEYHCDAITDLLSIWPDLLVSSSQDGVIKIWKCT